MELKVINESGQSSQTVQVSDVVFGREYNEPLIHQLVVAYQANARQGTRAQKIVRKLKLLRVSLGAKKGLVVPVLVWLQARCGAVVVRFSQIVQMRTSLKK